MARWQFRVWAIGPVLGNHFLRVSQTSTDRNQILSLIEVGLRRIERRPDASDERKELIRRSHCEWSDFIPLRTDKRWGHCPEPPSAVRSWNRELPATLRCSIG